MEHVARVAENRKTHRDLTAKLEGKRPLVRASCRWKCDIEMDLKGKAGRGGLD